MNRQEITLFALEETQKNSFEKMSMQSLADKFGVKKASFYYHFPSKNALAVAVIDEAKQRLEQYFEQFSKRATSRQLEAYIRVFSVHMQPIEQLCPGVGFITTWSSQPDEVKEAVSALYQTHHNHLTKLIDMGKMRGEFKTQESTNELAESIFCLLQGSLLTARVTASKNVFSSVRCSIYALVGVIS